MRVCVFILVGGLERFTVLVGIEAMAERQKLDDDLRNQLKETEAYANYLKTELTDLSNSVSLSNGERIGQRSSLQGREWTPACSKINSRD